MRFRLFALLLLLVAITFFVGLLAVLYPSPDTRLARSDRASITRKPDSASITLTKTERSLAKSATPSTTITLAESSFSIAHQDSDIRAEFSLPPACDPARFSAPLPYRVLLAKACAMGLRGPDSCCRTASPDVVRNVMHLFAPLIERELAPLRITERPADVALELDCGRQSLSHMFTGMRRAAPLFLVDAFIFAYELDLLEARLLEFETLVDRVVIAESEHSHRGTFKPRFFDRARRRGRFQRFESAVRVTDVDRCAAYIQEAETYSRMNDSRPQTIWPVQNAMVKCAFEGIVELAAAERWDVGNTFVLFSDLDELPSADTLLHIKHCEPRDPSLSSFGLELTTIAYNLRGATATLCASPPRAAIVPVQVTSMQQIVARQFPNRHPQPAANRLMRRAGVHLTQFGGGVISDFKGLTHGEGGGWNPIVVSNKDGANVFCTVSDAELCLREQLSVDQPHLVVRFWERGAAVPPLPAMRAARELVAQCGVPWALAFNEQRFAPHHGINVNIISNTFENRN